MFCYQCEQTASGSGCTKYGVCGKDPDIQSLQDTLVFALKGIGAYAFHARELGKRDEEVDAFMHEALFATLTNVDFDLNRYLELVLRAGKMNLRAMEILDEGNTERFGDPEPTEVETGTRAGVGVLVTGHDFLDLHALLEQTQGAGVNVYTHGEMLPAHAYPKLKAFGHLAGNYGSAWQLQKKEFAAFGGAILGTTNCVQIAPDSYRDRIFTCGIAGLPGVKHIEGRDFKEVIAKAKGLPPLPEAPGARKLLTGFHHKAVLALAPKIVEAVKAGHIRRFFLVGGCDGAKPGRSYYTDFVKLVPADCVVLTLACGKYRFNGLDLGAIDGIPRLLDIGQCNNAYSAIRIALALADAFGVRRERPAALARALVVRAEGGGDPADAARARHQGHPPGTDAAGVPHRERLQGAPGQVRPQAHHHARGGSEGNPGVGPVRFRGIHTGPRRRARPCGFLFLDFDLEFRAEPRARGQPSFLANAFDEAAAAALGRSMTFPSLMPDTRSKSASIHSSSFAPVAQPVIERSVFATARFAAGESVTSTPSACETKGRKSPNEPFATCTFTPPLRSTPSPTPRVHPRPASSSARRHRIDSRSRSSDRR